jgi:hypothetical protein
MSSGKKMEKYYSHAIKFILPVMVIKLGLKFLILIQVMLESTVAL